MKSPLDRILQRYHAHQAKAAQAKQPKPFGTYDFETYDWTKPLCADLYDGSTHAFALDRKDPMAVCRALLHEMEASEVTTFWAHNGGKYDALFLVECIRQLKGWRCDGAVAAGRIINLRVITPHSSFSLKDSYAVIQSGLESALKSFEIPHAKVFTKEEYARLDTLKECCAKQPDKHSAAQPYKFSCKGDTLLHRWSMRDFDDDKLKRGCQADTEALHALVTKAAEMFSEWGGQLKSTFSASALTVVKAQVKKPLPSHDGKQGFNDIGKKTYAGGRVEVFQHTPKGLQTEVDVTSSYPWSMTQPLPWQLYGWDKPDLYASDRLQLVYARVEVPNQYIPPLPFVPPTGGLYFPWGTWSGWFTSAELVYAIEQCGVNAKLLEAVSYTVQQPFKQFVETVFADKQTATGARREFDKLVLNGCYGKFAQKPENTRLMMFDSAEEGIKWARANAAKEPTPLNGSRTAWSVKTYRWPAQTHYALASFITAYSRILLHKHLTHAARWSKALSYCDTDSVHAAQTVDWSSKLNTELGGLKVELERYRARFYAPKLYELHPVSTRPAMTLTAEAQYYREPHALDRYEVTPASHFASKGFPVNAEAFQRIVNGERVGNPKGRMQLVKTQVRKGGGVKHLSEDETAKQWSGRSNKRRALQGSETGDTEPWHVSDIYEGTHLDQLSPAARNRTE